MVTFTPSMPYRTLKRASTRHIEPKSLDQKTFSLNVLNLGARLAYAYSVSSIPNIVTEQLSLKSNRYAVWFHPRYFDRLKLWGINCGKIGIEMRRSYIQ
jgi:hypothetical protein